MTDDVEIEVTEKAIVAIAVDELQPITIEVSELDAVSVTLDTNANSVIQGTSRTVRLTASTPTGPLDLTTAVIHARWVNDSDVLVVEKSSADAAEVEILAQSGETLGNADIFLVPDDTDPLPFSSRYRWDVWVIIGGKYHAAKPFYVTLVDAVTDL